MRRLRAFLYRMFLARTLLGAIAAVIVRRLTRGKAHPSWSLPYEVGVEVNRRFMNNGGTQIRRGSLASDAAVPRNPIHAQRVSLGSQVLAGQRADVHTPNGYGAGDPTLLYWHGGGYVSCSPRTHRALVCALADASGARCIAPSYPLAPSKPFPAALNAALACYRELLASGVSPSQLVVAGDSAGAGLTLAMLLSLRDAGEQLPCAVVLLSPWVDLECTGASVQAHACYDYLSPELIDQASRWYAGTESRRHPLISPIHADLRGLPPMLVLTGGVEVFHSENELFVERLRQADVRVAHEVAENAVHVFPLLSMVSAQGRQAERRIGRFVREHTSTQQEVPIAAAVASI
jgi:monoterpene epsilon-lactone hydrolase